jgi:PAS domain S-box-containing protein
MKNGKPALPDARVLRQRAEQKLRERQALAKLPPGEIDARALVHELEVHQIELEMQNEELRHAEAQAQEALDKYADLFDFAPLGYFHLTQDGVIREANLAGAALLGLDRSRVVSGRFAAWVAPACLRTFASFRKAVLASETRQTCEIQLLCQGRGALDAQLEGLAPPAQAGLEKTWRLAVLDVWARKQAEAALRKSEALAQSEKEFRLLAEAMPQIVWATRADGWNTYFNQQWVDYTGLTREESYGHGWNKPFHPDDQQRAWDAWQNAVTNRATYALEFRLRRADGTYRWWLVRGVPVLDEKGIILKWFGTCTDINDFKEAEKALLEAGEERLRLVLEATSMGIFEVDLRTGEGRWNMVEFELLGLKPGDAPSVPATFFRYLHPDDASRVQAQWAEATQTGILNTEFRIVRADGQMRWLAGMGRFAYAGKPDDSAPGDKPAPERFLGVNFDITERRQMEEEIRQRAEELRATNEELTRFNDAMVGRELRMIELKQEIDALCAQLGQPLRYGPIPGEEAQPAQ